MHRLRINDFYIICGVSRVLGSASRSSLYCCIRLKIYTYIILFQFYNTTGYPLQCILAVRYRRFGTIYRSQLQRSSRTT